VFAKKKKAACKEKSGELGKH